MKRILIVLPTYNEELVVEKNSLKVFDFCQEKFSAQGGPQPKADEPRAQVSGWKNYDWQILIADNGSTDRTVALAKKLSAQNQKISFFHIPEKGRGYALKKAWSREYPADFYAYMDIDLSSDLNAFPLLIEALENPATAGPRLGGGNYQLATGSRLKTGHQTKRSIPREILSRGYNLLLKILFHPSFQDAQCGFKAITKEITEKILPKIKNNNWFFDTEMFILAENAGYKIKEIPIEWLEKRVEKRKSSVKILATVWEDIKGMIDLSQRLKNF